MVRGLLLPAVCPRWGLDLVVSKRLRWFGYLGGQDLGPGLKGLTTHLRCALMLRLTDVTGCGCAALEVYGGRAKIVNAW